MSDPYFNTSTCVDRLFKVYQKYGNIIIALDFDETIYPYHKKDDSFDRVIKLIQECSKLGFDIIIFTSGLNNRHSSMLDYCKVNNINISAINQNSRDFKFGKDGAKVYYNILLDDKAGLGQAYEILKHTISKIKDMQETKEQDGIVGISKVEYDRLLERDEWLGYLEMVGVDNWDGYSIAQEIMEDESEKS